MGSGAAGGGDEDGKAGCKIKGRLNKLEYRISILK